MPAYTLHYFNGQGQGEIIRWVLHYADTPFDDVRHEWDEWLEFKKTFASPFKQMPTLIIDGNKYLSQSGAIVRFLGRELGLSGKSSWDQARSDMLYDRFCDMWVSGWGKVMYPAYMANREKPFPQLLPAMIETYKEFNKTHLQPFLQRYEELLAENGTGVFVGSDVTIVDIAISMLINRCHTFDPLLPTQYPNIGKLYVKVMLNKSIVGHIAKRAKEAIM